MRFWPVRLRLARIAVFQAAEDRSTLSRATFYLWAVRLIEGHLFLRQKKMERNHYGLLIYSMIKEPWFTLNQFRSRGDENPTGYQQFDINVKEKLLIPSGKAKLKSDILEDFLPSIVFNKSVLDIGCDKGYFSWLASKSGAKKVVANDVSGNPTNYAKTLFKFLKMDVEVVKQNLFVDKEDWSFDIVMALAVIHQTGLDLEKTISIIRDYSCCGALIEFCEDYQVKFGKSWNVVRFENIVKQYFNGVKMIGKYPLYQSERSLWYCEI